jgi:hypothetical protein
MLVTRTVLADQDDLSTHENTVKFLEMVPKDSLGMVLHQKDNEGHVSFCVGTDIFIVKLIVSALHYRLIQEWAAANGEDITISEPEPPKEKGKRRKPTKERTVKFLRRGHILQFGVKEPEDVKDFLDDLGIQPSGERIVGDKTVLDGVTPTGTPFSLVLSPLIGDDGKDAVSLQFIPRFDEAFYACAFDLMKKWGYENLVIGQMEAFSQNVRL